MCIRAKCGGKRCSEKGSFPHYYESFQPSTDWLLEVLGELGLFFSIIFHELSHSLVALNMLQLVLFFSFFFKLFLQIIPGYILPTQTKS